MDANQGTQPHHISMWGISKLITTVLFGHIRRSESVSSSGSITAAVEANATATLPSPNKPHLQEVQITIPGIEPPSCRICQETTSGRGKEKLVAPCGCKGSAQLIHKKCLQKWASTKKSATCELCQQQYNQRYLRIPWLTSKEENTAISGTMVLVLLFGVLCVSTYLFISHVIQVKGQLFGDSWMLLTLVLFAAIGVTLFLAWYLSFVFRTCRSGRARDLEGLIQSSIDPGTDVTSRVETEHAPDLSNSSTLEPDGELSFTTESAAHNDQGPLTVSGTETEFSSGMEAISADGPQESENPDRLD